MLGWEIPSPLEENPTHTYDSMGITFDTHWIIAYLLGLGSDKHVSKIATTMPGNEPITKADRQP